jgi:hypothetical protein
MKKILLAVIVLLSIIVIPSCKKGEDDPFISLRSRDARITAKWKLVNYEKTSSSSTGSTSSFLNGSILTETTFIPSYGSFTDSDTYSKEWEINSDGTFTSTTFRDSSISTSKSTWYWLNTTDDKTSIIIEEEGIYTIDRLTSKELIVRSESSSTNTNNSQTSTSNNKEVLTFEKQ